MHYIDELFESDHQYRDKIISLLKHAIISPEEKDSIEREVRDYIDSQRAEELILYLFNNQIDPITAGHNYGQGDIIKKIKNEQFNNSKSKS